MDDHTKDRSVVLTWKGSGQNLYRLIRVGSSRAGFSGTQPDYYVEESHRDAMNQNSWNAIPDDELYAANRMLYQHLGNTLKDGKVLA